MAVQVLWWAYKGFKSKGMHMAILNVLRVCTIIGLLSVVVACWALAIKINMDKPFFVFDAASLVFMSMIATFLICSEIDIAAKFFRSYFPVFGPDKGLAWLSLALVMIGCNMLGQLNNKNVEADNVGFSWYSLALASGIMNLAFGVLNLILGLLFGLGSSNARQVRRFGSAPDTSSDLPQYDASSSIHDEKNKGPSSLSFPKRIFRKVAGGGLMRRNCEDTTPSRSTSPHHEAYNLERNASPSASDDDRLNHRNEALDRLSGRDQDYNAPSSSSKPLTSPIAPNVRRPDSHQHPAFKFNVPRPPSSVYDGPRNQHYSTASGMTQFPTGPYDRV